MKLTVKIAWLLVVVLGLGTFTSLFLSKKFKTASKTVNIERFTDGLKQESEDVFKEVLPVSFSAKTNSFVKGLKAKKWYLITYNNGIEEFWNSNKISLDSAVLESTQFPIFYRFGDDVYSVFKNNNAYLAFRLANDGKLHKKLIDEFPELKNFKLSMNSLKNKAWHSNELSFEHKGQNYSTTLYVFIALSLVLLFLTFYYTNKNSKKSWITTDILVIINVLVGWVLPFTFSDYYLLSTSSFISFSETNLLLLLSIHLIAAFSILLLLFQLIPKDLFWLGNLSKILVLFFLSDLIIDLSINLIKNSFISFDFEKLFGLTTFSFYALAIICLYFIALWGLSYLSRIRRFNSSKDWIVLLISASIFIVFQVVDARRGVFDLVLPIALVIISLLAFNRVKKPKRGIYLHFLLTALATSIIVFSSHKQRENIYIEQFAKELIKSEDLQAERILKSFENQLAQEFLIPEDYVNFINKKDAIEYRIKQLYFSNYLEKYDLKLFSFDSGGININQNALYSFYDLDSVYNNNTSRTQSDYFYLINNPTTVNGYIAKYENCDLDGHNGTTFILLQPRVVQSEFLYPEVFANQQSKQIINMQDYSYGTYFNNQLINQNGSFPYKLNRTPANSNSTFTLRKNHHRIYSDGNYEVVLTKTENQIRSWLSSFTFTLILLIPLSFLLSLGARVFLSNEHALSLAFIPGTSKYLSSRIQTSLTIILLAALLLSVYIIISFIRSNYNQNLENQLLVKVKNISTQFQNKVDLNKKLQNNEQRTLILNEESSTYKVDINLYDANGKLLSSTKPYLIETEVLANRMNPKAYTKLKLAKTSQLLIQEELEGSDYLSAYVPLFDGTNKVIAYLNTPFFAKNEELNKQISSLVVNIINIYLMLLLCGVIIAYVIAKQISKPLLLIREKIAKTELRGENELIVYDRDDEIGQLVKQYNKMVLELEESADQMAETEREGAWREMAKQVAHEIKNPLTPMKLSIQHLQRAYLNGPSEKLNILFKKTSKLLIEQIDSLSNMASEFSNFAKMPEDKFERFNLSEILSGTVDLFIRSENVDIQANIAKGIYTYADPEQLRRVFNNLIKNAIQAIPDERNGHILVSLNIDQKTAHIEVKDNGKGIPKQNYKKVFVPNFSTKNSGMGLGLAICRKIVESAKGNINFVSEVNKGTIFQINLPLSESK